MKAIAIGMLIIAGLMVMINLAWNYADNNLRNDHIERMKNKEVYNENTKHWTVTDDKYFYVMDKEKKTVLFSEANSDSRILEINK